MRVTERIKIAVIDGRSQKRYTRATLFFLMLSVIVFVGVNCIIGSIQDSIHTLEDKPDGRILVFVGREDQMRELKDYLEMEYDNREALGDVFYLSSDNEICWEDSKEYMQEDFVNISIFSYFQEIRNYFCDGENRKPEAGEVVLPKYLYDMGVYDNVNYYDAGTLVGKNIEVTVRDVEGKHTETLKVIGTYNNVSSQMSNKFLMNDEQMLEWYLNLNGVTEKTISRYLDNLDEEQLEEIAVCIEMEYLGDEEAFWLDWLGAEPYVCIYVKPEYNMEAIGEDIFEKTEMRALKYTVLDDSLLLYLDFLKLAGNLISGLLILTTMINITLMTSAEVSRREKDFALRCTQGFLKRDVIVILALEKFISFGLAVLGAVAVVGVLMFCGNYVIDQLFPFYLRYVELSYDGGILLGAIGCAAIGVVLGMCVALPKLWKLDLVRTLKRE